MKPDELRSIFEACDVGWIFDEAEEDRARQILREMEAVDEALAGVLSPLRLEGVARAVSHDSQRLKPLVQSFASPMTAPMRAMIYCLLEGAQVKEVRYDYLYRTRSRLVVGVEFDSGERVNFESSELWDAEVLKHFGMMKMGDAPVLDGYYPFRKGE